MDLTKFLGQDTQEQSTQRLSKEEYAAQKKQEREEIWGMIEWKGTGGLPEWGLLKRIP